MNNIIESRWVSVGDLRVHFKHSGSGIPCVLLHGNGNDWHEWSENIEALSSTHEVFALDFPGFGRSEAPSYPVPTAWTVSFIKEFIDTLGLHRPLLIGHSLGGLILAAFALEHPGDVRKLVLVDSAGLGRPSLIGIILSRVFKTLDKVAGMQRGPEFIGGFSPAELPVAARLNELTMPVLIIWGESDHYFPRTHAEKSGKLIPCCEWHIFGGCRHAPQRESPRKFNELLNAFLKGESDKNQFPP